MKKYELRLTSAMGIEGKLYRAGTVVVLDEKTAKDFLRRGRAELLACEEIEQDPGASPDLPDFQKLNKKQLLDLAGELGIEADEAMTKAEIIKAIDGGSEE